MANDRVSIRVDAEDRTKSAIASAKAGLRDYQQQIDRVQATMRSFGTMTLGAVSFASLTAGIKSVTETVSEVDRLRNTLAQGVGTENVSREMQYLSQISKQLGLDLTTAGASYGSFMAAARGTAIEGEEARKAFEAVSKAATTLGLSADQTQGALLAMQQMISKGKVQAEELNGQLGERLPGAFQIAARAMGMTTEELDKFMSAGNLVVNSFIPKFAQQLEEEFGAGAERAAQSMQATVNRLSTSWTELKQTLSEGPVGDGVGYVIGNLTKRLEQLKSGIDAVKASGSPFDFLKAADAKNFEQRAIAAGAVKSGRINGVSDYIDSIIDATADMDAARRKAEEAAGVELDKFMRKFQTDSERAKEIGEQIRKLGAEAGKSSDEVTALITKATTPHKSNGKSAIEKASDDLVSLQDRLNQMKMSSFDFDLSKFVRIGGTQQQNSQAEAILREIEARNQAIAAAERQNEAFDAEMEKREQVEKSINDLIRSVREEDEERQLSASLATASDEERRVRIALLDAERAGLEKSSAAYQQYAEMLKSNADASRLETLTAGNPARQFSQFAADMELLERNFEKTGDLVEYAFGKQQAEKISGMAKEIEKASDYSSQFVMTFTSGFEEALFSSKKLKDVINELIIDIAKLILRTQLLQPMFQSLMSGMSGGTTWWGALSGMFGGSGSSAGSAAAAAPALIGAGYDASGLFQAKSTGSQITIQTTNNFTMGELVQRSEFDEWTRTADERTKMVVASAVDRGEVAL